MLKYPSAVRNHPAWMIYGETKHRPFGSSETKLRRKGIRIPMKFFTLLCKGIFYAEIYGKVQCNQGKKSP